jgi:hypothetical protein
MALSPQSREVRRLLSRLCIELGFCLPPGDQARLEGTPPETVEAFASAVVLAEGLDPVTMDSTVYRQVKDMVAEEFRRAERGSPIPPRA